MSRLRQTPIERVDYRLEEHELYPRPRVRLRLRLEGGAFVEEMFDFRELRDVFSEVLFRKEHFHLPSAPVEVFELGLAGSVRSQGSV